MKIKPPIIALIYLAISLILHFLLTKIKIIKFPYDSIGILISVFGILLTTLGIKTFKKNETTKHPFGKPTAMVTNGPFRLTRNPMYLGLTLFLLGIAVIVGTIPMFLAPAAFFSTINISFIPREEKLLKNIFGGRFFEYKRRVRRWV